MNNKELDITTTTTTTFYHKEFRETTFQLS
jgi:hypothetical protein